jgi:hypothetical protein
VTRVVYSSPSNEVAIVSAYDHGDGSKWVVISPLLNSESSITLNIHWSAEEARQVAAMLMAAADATDEAAAGGAR